MGVPEAVRRGHAHAPTLDHHDSGPTTLALGTCVMRACASEGRKERRWTHRTLGIPGKPADYAD